MDLTKISSTAVMRLTPPSNLDNLQRTRKRTNKSFNSYILRGDRYTALIYPNGSVVILGCKSLSNLQYAMFDISSNLKAMILQDPRITNEVYTGSYKRHVDLLETFNNLNNYSEDFIGHFEPELFPVLLCMWKDRMRTCSLRKSNAKLQVFYNGKIVITGVTNKDEALKLPNLVSSHIVFK